MQTYFAVPKIFIWKIWLHFHKKYMDVFNCSAIHNSFHDSLWALFSVVGKQAIFESLHKANTSLVIVSIWSYSIVWVLAIAFNLTYTTQNLVPPRLYYAYLGLHVGIPILVIPLIYIKIYTHVNRSREHLREISTTTTLMSVEIRLAKTMGIIISLFYLIWLPVLVIEVLRSHNFNKCTIKKVDSLNVWLTCLNGCLDPLVYSFRSSEVKESLKALKQQVKDFCKSSCSSHSRPFNTEKYTLLGGSTDWTNV